MQLSLACLLLLSVLQLLLLRRQLGVYLRYRHYITVINRVLRGLALGLLPVLNHGNDVLSSWGSRQQHSAAAALAVYTCLASAMQLQVSLTAHFESLISHLVCMPGLCMRHLFEPIVSVSIHHGRG
jgi:hypothetical protein